MPTSRPPLPSLRLVFPPLQTARAEAEIDRACEVDKGHGRVERRTIEVTSSLAGYLGSDWPGSQQVFRLTRERTIKGKTETEVVFGITSLLPERAGVKGLLGLTRGHWGIENGLHGVRDGTLREDASRIRKGSGPEVMAALRNIVIFLFKRFGHKSAAAATRHYCAIRRNRWTSCQPQSENETALPLRPPVPGR
ncbi:MAG: ISAs1 family transposase [Planctomycetaceae bacterium]|nr:ISAs1 family transposase [Planctomycetaceae bacterium]